MCRVLVLLALTVAVHAGAQTFNIGDTKAEVRKAVGPPQSIYSVAFTKLFKPEEEEFAASAGRIDDVWEIRTATNAFQMRAVYLPDPSASRLHPVERLSTVTYLPDKDELASQMLGSIGIARSICSHGCDVYGLRGGANYYEVWVCRSPSGPNDSHLIAGSYAGWGSYDPDAIYALCTQINYGRHPEFGNTPAAKIDWKSMAVDRITVGGEDLRFLTITGKEGVGWVRLPTWQPPS